MRKQTNPLIFIFQIGIILNFNMRSIFVQNEIRLARLKQVGIVFLSTKYPVMVLRLLEARKGR